MANESPAKAMSVLDVASTLKPRAYQQEMLAESLRQNTIVAVSPKLCSLGPVVGHQYLRRLSSSYWVSTLLSSCDFQSQLKLDWRN